MYSLDGYQVTSVTEEPEEGSSRFPERMATGFTAS
jgi:hypothetical protein